MNPTKKQARIAGLLYLLASIPAPFGLMYVPNKLIVANNASATADHLRASESLLRLAMASELLSCILFIFVAIALYRLFKPVNPTQALTMMILILVSIPISLLVVVNEVAALLLVSGAHFLSVFPKEQLDALAYVFVRLHGRGILVAEIFWGLWLFPFAALIIRSGFIPSVLGILLIIAGVGYVADSTTFLLLPTYGPLVARFAVFLEAAELPIIFWLLIWGVRSPRTDGSTP